MQGGDRYVIRSHPDAPDLWDVVDTMRDGEVVFGGEALNEGQAREMAATLNQIWREWRHRLRDYILRAQFSARPARIPDAVGFCLVPMDPIAGLVGLRLVDFLSAYRRVGTEAGMSSVSSFAHLGGAAVGVVAWLIWRKEKPNDEARMSNVEGNPNAPNNEMAWCASSLIRISSFFRH